jgi:enoyl-CoA hydratase/carnithine racemase
MTDVIIDRREAVLEVRFARPAKKNAVTLDMYRAASAALEAAGRDEGVRAVAFTAEGETFCAGNDVHDFLAGAGADDAPPALRFVQAVAGFPKPMIAAVHGAAVGIGATMLLHMDLVYASETARLHMPFVGLGLVPEAGSSLLLPRRVGQVVAAEMMLLGTPLGAARAKELGLVNEIVASAALREHALAKAAELAEKPPQALRLTRALLRGSAHDVSARIAEEAGHFAACLTSAEAREAFTAFLQRRRPDFSARA